MIKALPGFKRSASISIKWSPRIYANVESPNYMKSHVCCSCTLW